MFLIEALLNLLKKKTKKISIGEVIPYANYNDSSKEELSNGTQDFF